MKKTVKQISILLGLCLLFAFILSCDNPVSLGSKLDILGPEIVINSPPDRMPIATMFTLEGTATDGTGVKLMLVKIVLGEQMLPRQWRFIYGGWQISEDFGVSWATYLSENNSWLGNSMNALWSLDVNLPEGSPNGEYTVIVQAWDKANFSDENSYKTRVVIIDNVPPKIVINDPYLYIEYGTTNKIPVSGEYGVLFSATDTDYSVMRDPANIGKFTASGFKMQYQIDDNSDVWSIEIRLYDGSSVIIDEDPNTVLPEEYIFSFYDNLGPPPEIPVPSLNIKPNGAAQVPELDGYDPLIRNRINQKTSVVVVGVCYDAAGNVNQEKILGSFIYWPKAKIPWITFPEGMNVPSDYETEFDVYMVYPGREVKANAFQIFGVTKVEYSLYRWAAWDSGKEDSPLRSGEFYNPERFGGFSTVFQWSFLPPSSTGYYSIVAKAYGNGGIESEDFEMMFFVQDVSFPDFPELPSPSASLPLYQSIGKADMFENPTDANKIRIHGYVSDATAIESVYLVWINPQSKQYAAMSQLSYFRDQNYKGWKYADNIDEGAYADEGEYDPNNKNKVWKVPITYIGKDPITDRNIYQYSQLIDITDQLNIAGSTAGKDNPLKSQTFLLRARNPDDKCTIITYAPQGDESAPIITKKPHPAYPNDRDKDYQIKVTVTNSSNTVLKTCYSGHYELIDQFKVGDKITVEGEWEEDSIGYLNFQDYLKNNIEITINGYKIDGNGNTSLTYTPTSGKGFTKGTWKAEATFGSSTQGSSYKFLADNIKDTLVVSITIKDIGGNITEAGGSWLIRSDTLRLLRIASDMADTKYNASSTPIRIFLEFNKPVELTNPSAVPELQLNVTGGTDTTKRTAKYVAGATQSTKQYFEYTIQPGHGTSDPVLDVTGLVGVSGSNYWTPSTYAFSWFTGTGQDREDIKITLPSSGHAPGTVDATSGSYLRRLPVYTNTNVSPSDQDRVYSFRGNKNIEIDTTPPTVSGIASTNPAGFYTTGADIFIEVSFNENVKIDGTPKLQLQLRTSATATRSVDTDGTVKVNGDKISFTYTVKNGDTTWGNPIVVTGFTGNIYDIAGNELTTMSTYNLNGTTVTTIRGIEANTPAVPVVKIKDAAENTNGNTTANVVINKVGTNDITGISTGDGTAGAAGTPVNLSTLYQNDIWFAIDGNTTKGAHTLNALEYSINNGTDWVRVTPTSNSYVMKLPRSGDYKIIARQIDKAGNVSNWSQPITLNWDPGALVTSITSTSANGTYTSNTGRNSINIRINFRKPLTFSAAAAPNTNVINLTSGIVLDGGQTGTARSYLDYTYTVGASHSTNGANLDVTSLGTITATDSGNVSVSSFITMPSGTNALLKNNKSIIVDTSPLQISTGPSFADGTVQTDGSWTGRLEITFNNNVAKGTGNIRIEQIAGTNDDTRYRLPAVLTEAQYNKLRGVSSIDSFYTRGTNGYTASGNSGASDTSTKYILKYSENPANITPSGTDAAGTITRLADDMRKAEAIEININAQAVTISGKTLTVDLTGSNALPVAGASYAVTYPAGLVQDNLDNSLAIRNDTTGIATTGIARPYIRIQRSQDLITSNGSSTTVTTGTTTRATYSATQPLTSQARMDCRTPGSSVVYRYIETRTTTNALNWQTSGPSDSLTAGNPDPSNIGDPATNTTGNYGTFTSTTTPITLPITSAAQTEYQGYQCLIRAKGRTGNAGSYAYSAASDEIAYRTVLTYRIMNMSNNGDWTQTILRRENDTSGTQTLGAQVWIRGGDAIGSSTTPGFPLTWSDDWYALSGKRAGIRLLSLPTAPATSMDAASEWKFVSWEINVPAYFDIIKGYSTTNDVPNLIWQYGPREYAYQRAGWTSYKEQYPMYPGKHRWLYVNADQNFEGKDKVNFSNTYTQRRTFTANEGWTGPNTANAAP